MTVGELINKLAQFSPCAEVGIKVNTLIENKNGIDFTEIESNEDIDAIRYTDNIHEATDYVDICVNHTISKEDING